MNNIPDSFARLNQRQETAAMLRRAGVQVVLVGNCRSGWASDVFGWDDVHVESGSTPRYKPYPTCDATYPRHVYDTEIVRYYEDSTWLSSAVDPTGSPDAHAASTLVAGMPSRPNAIETYGAR